MFSCFCGFVEVGEERRGEEREREREVLVGLDNVSMPIVLG